MTSLSRFSLPLKTGLIAIAALFCMTNVSANLLFYTVDLRGAVQQVSPTPFISYVVSPTDLYSNTWFETVLKINLRDPAQTNPYDYAEFKISYDGAPTGLTVNIGDSSTNNGGSGDGGTQSNDAEMQIGALLSNPAQFSTLKSLVTTMPRLPTRCSPSYQVSLTSGSPSC